jgi:OFA family oxalate/formate antiporter-like MFS transporter
MAETVMAPAARLFGMKAEAGRWIFVILGFIINICLGSVYAFSVFKTPVQKLLNIGAFEGGLPFMFFLAFFAIFMFFGGRLLDKLGPRNVCMIGGAIVGAGWILAGLLTDTGMLPGIWALVITYGVIAGAGVGLVYGGPIAVANKWFPDKKGIAVGLTVAGFGGSPFVTAYVASALINANGPVKTFLIMGIVLLVVVILLSTMLRFPVAGWKPKNWQPSASAASSSIEMNRNEIVKTRTFWGLFLCFTIGCLAGLMAIGISSPVGTEIIKMDSIAAASLVSVFAIFNGAGRPLFGWFTDRLTPRWAAVISLFIIFVASVLMLQATEGTIALYTICFIALWLCLGGWLAIAPSATSIFFGAKHYASNYGVVYFAYGIGAILANIISGQSKDLFGNYNVAFIITASLSIVGIIMAALLMRPVKVK